MKAFAKVLSFKYILLIFIMSHRVKGTERLSEQKEEKLFGAYLKMFNITFHAHHRFISTPTIEISRENAKENFLQNFYSIEAHNQRYKAGKETYRQGVNPMSYLSREEFKKFRTGVVKSSKLSNVTGPNEIPEPEVPKTARLALPEYFNWADYGIVTPVRTQGLCGACYAFAALAAVESQMGLRGIHVKLSEQEIVDCATHEIHYERVLLGCTGGDDTAVYDFAKKHRGVTSEHEYPFEMKVNRCRTNRPRVHGSAVQGYVKLPPNEEHIKKVLYLHGPLYASFHASDAFSQYQSGIFTDPRGDCRGEKSSHAALIVGWGTEHGLDYWICKNSYDTWWGENGYFRIARGYNLCNIANEVSYPILN